MTRPLRVLPPNPSTQVADFLSLGEWLVGQCTVDPVRRLEAMTFVCGPEWRAALQVPFRMPHDDLPSQGVSTCGLVASGLLRLSGWDMPPSNPGKVVEDLAARSVKYSAEAGAAPGDVLILMKQDRHAEHVVIVRQNRRDGVLDTIEGGQVGFGGLQIAAFGSTTPWNPRIWRVLHPASLPPTDFAYVPVP